MIIVIGEAIANRMGLHSHYQFFITYCYNISTSLLRYCYSTADPRRSQADNDGLAGKEVGAGQRSTIQEQAPDRPDDPSSRWGAGLRPRRIS